MKVVFELMVFGLMVVSVIGINSIQPVFAIYLPDLEIESKSTVRLKSSTAGQSPDSNIIVTTIQLKNNSNEQFSPQNLLTNFYLVVDDRYFERVLAYQIGVGNKVCPTLENIPSGVSKEITLCFEIPKSLPNTSYSLEILPNPKDWCDIIATSGSGCETILKPIKSPKTVSYSEYTKKFITRNTDIKANFKSADLIEQNGFNILKIDLDVTNLTQNRIYYSWSDIFVVAPDGINYAAQKYDLTNAGYEYDVCTKPILANPKLTKSYSFCFEVPKESTDFGFVVRDGNFNSCDNYSDCTEYVLNISDLNFISLSEPSVKELDVWVQKLPEWASFASNVTYESTEYWKEKIPDLQFYLMDEPSQADFQVYWVRDFGGEHAGIAIGSQFIQVGLGDSNCNGKWNPYSANHVAHIMKHEIGHVLGYDHVDDPDNVMYPYASNKEYGKIEEDLDFVENYGYFIPVCTSKQVTSFDYTVTTNDPTYGFDVYFVPDKSSLDKWAEGEPFEYYADASCHGKNYLAYTGVCKSIAGTGGLMIITDDVLSERLTKITVKLQEVSTSWGTGSTELKESASLIDPEKQKQKTEEPSGLASFFDPDTDSHHYVDRYNNEPQYREWFDDNFPSHTIYEAVGLKNPLYFVDPEIDPQHYVDRYNNEPQYREWFDDNFPSHTIYEAVGVREPLSKIPSWVKSNAELWSDGLIDDQTFLSGIKYLIEQKIIVIDGLSESSAGESASVPSWIKSTAKLWREGDLDDKSFVNAIKYLVEKGIIIVVK